MKSLHVVKILPVVFLRKQGPFCVERISYLFQMSGNVYLLLNGSQCGDKEPGDKEVSRKVTGLWNLTKEEMQ